MSLLLILSQIDEQKGDYQCESRGQEQRDDLEADAKVESALREFWQWLGLVEQSDLEIEGEILQVVRQEPIKPEQERHYELRVADLDLVLVVEHFEANQDAEQSNEEDCWNQSFKVLGCTNVVF